MDSNPPLGKAGTFLVQSTIRRFVQTMNLDIQEICELGLNGKFPPDDAAAVGAVFMEMTLIRDFILKLPADDLLDYLLNVTEVYVEGGEAKIRKLHHGSTP